jgi:hypothetical protein
MNEGGTSIEPWLVAARLELDRAADTSLSVQERGAALEHATSLFFQAVSGCEILDRRGVDRWRSRELDLVIGNRRREDGLFYLPHVFPVECKNSDKPVPAGDVATFASKVRHSQCDLGVLVAASGVTGRRNGVGSAYQTAATEFAQGVRLLLVTVAELATITTGAEFAWLLNGKLGRLVSDGTFSADD